MGRLESRVLFINKQPSFSPTAIVEEKACRSFPQNVLSKSTIVDHTLLFPVDTVIHFRHIELLSECPNTSEERRPKMSREELLAV